MARVLVTGGTGGLGSLLVPRLRAAGHAVRIGSRAEAPVDLEDGLEWAQMDLREGTGIERAVVNVDVVIHAASSPFRRTKQTDVEGTRRLLDAIQAHRVGWVHYISIVGVDQMPQNPYYRAKWAAEQLVESSGLPFTILRATQFHSLLDTFLRTLFKLGPLLLVPRAAKFQLIDASEVADHMVENVAVGPSGRLPPIGGPEVLTTAQIVNAWLAATRARLLKVPIPSIGPLKPFAEGLNCCPDQSFGQLTWQQWLDRTFPTS